MIDADDVQLQIKKKARRRLVGAIAFAAFAALVLPMVMDQEPAPPAQEVEIRIPGQDGKPFQPALAPVPPPVEIQAAEPETPAPVAVQAAPVATPAPAVAAPPPPPAQVAQVIKLEPRPEPKPEPKPAPTPAPKPEPAKVEKPAPRTAAAEAQRAADILAGKTPSSVVTPAAASGQHVILIGAFANEANVKTIKTKLGELGIKVYTEPLDSPQGKKTRVRAGPFPSRDAADKALEKMKRIGVSGIVSAQ